MLIKNITTVYFRYFLIKSYEETCIIFLNFLIKPIKIFGNRNYRKTQKKINK